MEGSAQFNRDSAARRKVAVGLALRESGRLSSIEVCRAASSAGAPVVAGGPYPTALKRCGYIRRVGQVWEITAVGAAWLAAALGEVAA